MSLGARPESDPIARAVALARVTSALLGTDEKVKLGRYHLLERAGAGGMGVVYAAWDPELDRRVAIKIVRVESSAKRERALAEGQALAKLAHPNVVTVHDVGVLDDQLFLVMEWIRGKNLRVYCQEPRTIKELVAVYRAAGEGLRAAHEAGLVHRDFKPENAMRGDDGRVRVLDFGLALAELDEPASAAGTPRYMAPEQQRGEALTAAADQYAFCVALREAIVRRNADGTDAAVPAWLAAIVERGVAADAAGRFPSMNALLRVLSHDPATVWRRRLAVAAAVAIGGGAFALGVARGGDEIEHCTGAPDELARSWNPTQHARVVAHLRELGAYGAAEADRIAKQLTDYGTQWSEAHRGACIAHERGEATQTLYERGLGCLARARVALETVGGVLGRVSLERLPDAIVASRGLPAVDRCVSETTASPIPLPAPELAREVEVVSADVARASYLVLAGDSTAANIARPAAAAADRIGYAPLVAQAQLALGSALVLERRPVADAIAAYERATAAAIEGGDDVTAVEAYARELFVAARISKDKLPAEAIDLVASLRLVSGLAERSGARGSFARTLLYNNVGTTRLAAGDTTGARRWFKQAYDVPYTGKCAIELWAVLGNLASTTTDATERARLFLEQREQLEAELGPTHVFTLVERVRSMQFVANGTAAVTQLDELCHALVKWHPHRIDKIDPCAYELALLLRTLGAPSRARAALALVSTNDTEPRQRLARATERFLEGDPASAARDAARVADEHAKQPQWWARFWAVEGWLLEAHARVALGDRPRAIEAARSALAMLAAPGFDLELIYLQRRLVAARALLAKLVPSAEAAVLAKQASDWYRTSGGYDALVAELDAITADSR